METDECVYAEAFYFNGVVGLSEWINYTKLEGYIMADNREIAVIGAKLSDLAAFWFVQHAAYYDESLTFTAWFLVRASDTITRDEIAEAVKWG